MIAAYHLQSGIVYRATLNDAGDRVAIESRAAGESYALQESKSSGASLPFVDGRIASMVRTNPEVDAMASFFEVEFTRELPALSVVP